MKLFRPNLVGKVSPEVERLFRVILDEVDNLKAEIARLRAGPSPSRGSSGGGSTSGAGLIGVLAQPTLGSSTTDSQLQSVSTTTGTVTSVGLAASPASVFDVAGSPITGAGTITLSMDNQAANVVLSGPSSGGAAQPAFRALVAGDLPVAAAQSTNAKVTAGAPFVNDGYIIVTINGVATKLMTTA